jgi:tetratricopeptide (TPR) repeat protein
MNQERVATLEKLLQLDPNDEFSNYALGLECLEDQPQRAEQQFLRVLELDPDYVAAYFQLGKLAADQDKPDTARTWLEKGIEVAEKVGDHHALGEMQDFLNDLD